jgi:hypothetical protein
MKEIDHETVSKIVRDKIEGNNLCSTLTQKESRTEGRQLNKQKKMTESKQY